MKTNHGQTRRGRRMRSIGAGNSEPKKNRASGDKKNVVILTKKKSWIKKINKGADNYFNHLEKLEKLEKMEKIEKLKKMEQIGKKKKKTKSRSK